MATGLPPFRNPEKRVLISTASGARIMQAAALSRQDLEKFHGKKITESREVFFDAKEKRVKAKRKKWFGKLALDEAATKLLPEDSASRALLTGIESLGISCLNWAGSAKKLREKIDFLHQKNPDGWPDVSDQALESSNMQWLEPFIGDAISVAEITVETLNNALQFYVGHDKISGLANLLPSHFSAPSGSRIPIHYKNGVASIDIRVQELFGLTTHPVIAGNVPILLNLLSPAQRPIQKTLDLPQFWNGSWLDVRSDMRGRYPKHFWPENAAQAEPTSRAKPRKS